MLPSSLLEVDCTLLICKHTSLVFIMLLLQRYRGQGRGGGPLDIPKTRSTKTNFCVRISSGGLGVFRVNRCGSKSWVCPPSTKASARIPRDVPGKLENQFTFNFWSLCSGAEKTTARKTPATSHGVGSWRGVDQELANF